MKQGLLALAAALALLLAQFDSGPAAADERSETIRALLEKRADAVMAKDKNSFLGTIDAGQKEFMQVQSAWFESIGALPLTEYALSLETVEIPELTRAGDNERFGSETYVAGVEERLRVEGYDLRPALGLQMLAFVKRGPEWLIASDRPLDELGIYSSRQPWDFGPVVIRRSEHFMFIAHPKDSAILDDLLSHAESSLSNVEAVWKRPWNRKIVVLLPGSHIEVERILDVTFDVGPFVAVAFANLDSDKGWVLASPRVVLNRENFVRHTPAVQKAIFAHELLHVASFDQTGPNVAAFVDEGLARLAESGGGPQSMRGSFSRRQFDGKLPENIEFNSGGPRSIDNSYTEALSSSVFIKERWGLDKLSAFYVDLGSRRIEAGTARFHLDQSFRNSLGLSFEEFEAEWARYAGDRS